MGHDRPSRRRALSGLEERKDPQPESACRATIRMRHMAADDSRQGDKQDEVLQRQAFERVLSALASESPIRSV